MAFGWHTRHMFGKDVDMSAHRRLGQCFIVMRCDAAVSEQEFRSSLQQMTEEVRKEEPAEGKCGTVLLVLKIPTQYRLGL